MMDKPIEQSFVLFCVGEDSGDILGESFVKTVVQSGFCACGSGGERMRSAGLVSIIDFEHLPVSGFGDVLCCYQDLSGDLKKMRSALMKKECIAFVAIDYPGFNMNLVKFAKKLCKPVLYIAPPQIWAWKSSRAKQLRGIPLVVFFDFEQEAYNKFGCNVQRMIHPLMGVDFVPDNKSKTGEIILLPGSRGSQAIRNIKAFLKTALDICPQNGRVTIFASRESLVKPFAEIVSQLTPCHSRVVVEKSCEISTERLIRYSKATFALVCPGTATLEIAFAECPMVVCTKPDVLTYVIGKLLVRTCMLSLPNLIIGEKKFAEFIVPPIAFKNWRRKLFTICQKTIGQPTTKITEHLRLKLGVGKSSQKLMLEFLRKFT